MEQERNEIITILQAKPHNDRRKKTLRGNEMTVAISNKIIIPLGKPKAYNDRKGEK